MRLGAGAGQLGGRGGHRSDVKVDFRHSGIATTRAYDMNAAIMQLERLERGIQVV